MNNKIIYSESGKSPLVFLVVSTLFLLLVLFLVNFTKIFYGSKNVLIKKYPIPISKTTQKSQATNTAEINTSSESSSEEDKSDCLDQSSGGCDDSEDVPLDPADLAGPD